MTRVSDCHSSIRSAADGRSSDISDLHARSLDLRQQAAELRRDAAGLRGVAQRQRSYAAKTRQWIREDLQQWCGQAIISHEVELTEPVTIRRTTNNAPRHDVGERNRLARLRDRLTDQRHRLHEQVQNLTDQREHLAVQWAVLTQERGEE